MNAPSDREPSETPDIPSRCSCGHSGTHRSLSALWELFQGTAEMHPEVPAENHLQNREETIIHSKTLLQTRK
jgi:hypothetical protein